MDGCNLRNEIAHCSSWRLDLSNPDVNGASVHTSHQTGQSSSPVHDDAAASPESPPSPHIRNWKLRPGYYSAFFVVSRRRTRKRILIMLEFFAWDYSGPQNSTAVACSWELEMSKLNKSTCGWGLAAKLQSLIEQSPYYYTVAMHNLLSYLKFCL